MSKTWEIGRDKLLEPLEVLDLVPSRPGLPSSEFIMVERAGKNGDIIVHLASEVTGTVTLKGDGKWPFEKPFYLDRRVFLPFVRASKDIKTKAPFKFTANEKQLVVKNGKRKAEFDGQPAVQGYGQPPSGKLVSRIELGNHTRGLIYCARECASADPVTPQLNCVYIQPKGGDVNVFATNQKIVYAAKSKTKLKSASPIPFPLYLVSLLGSDKLKEVLWKDKYVAITFPHGIIWQPVSAKANKNFPAKDIAKHMASAEKEPAMFTVDARKMASHIIRIIGYLAAVRRQDWALDLTGKKGEREVIVSSTVPQSSFRETLMLDHPCKSSFSLSWPLDMLEPVFDYLHKKEKGSVTIRAGEKGISYIIGSDIKVAIPRRKS